MRRAAPIVPTEKAGSAWKNAKARLGSSGSELESWLDGLQAVGEQDEALVLVDGVGHEPCRRCESLVSRALIPLGYAGARIFTRRELEGERAR